MKKYQQSKLTYEDLRPYAEGHYELGMQQGLNITALNALKEGLPLQVVSKITSLPISEIEKLKNQM